jgi:hypothetical protein
MRNDLGSRSAKCSAIPVASGLNDRHFSHIPDCSLTRKNWRCKRGWSTEWSTLQPLCSLPRSSSASCG